MKVDVLHSMSEMGDDKKKERTVLATTCNKTTCKSSEPDIHAAFKSIPTMANIAKFAGMSRAEKKNLLMKRSNDDYKKNIEPIKRQMDKDIVEQMKNP